MIFLQMAADVGLNWTNDIVRNITTALNSNIKVYRYVASQTLSKSENGIFPLSSFEPTAYHMIDSDVLFGIKYRFIDFNITESDQAYIRNMRRLVREFVYETTGFHTRYADKTIEFWNDQIMTREKPYHEQECAILRENGFLKRSWGQRG